MRVYAEVTKRDQPVADPLEVALVVSQIFRIAIPQIAPICPEIGDWWLDLPLGTGADQQFVFGYYRIRLIAE